MIRVCIQSFAMMLVFTLLTGVLYPLVVTLFAQTAFPEKANGSLLKRDDRVIGSSLIGQPFAAPGYFWSRPSGTGPEYNGGASSGSNYGIHNASLAERIDQRAEELRGSSAEESTPIPVDLLAASGSGLDPHISPAAAAWQSARVARTRGLPVEEVMLLVTKHTEGRQFGMLGEPRVNVLALNLALDALPRNGG